MASRSLQSLNVEEIGALLLENGFSVEIKDSFIGKSGVLSQIIYIFILFLFLPTPLIAYGTIVFAIMMIFLSHYYRGRYGW